MKKSIFFYSWRANAEIFFSNPIIYVIKSIGTFDFVEPGKYDFLQNWKIFNSKINLILSPKKGLHHKSSLPSNYWQFELYAHNKNKLK